MVLWEVVCLERGLVSRPNVPCDQCSHVISVVIGDIFSEQVVRWEVKKSCHSTLTSRRVSILSSAKDNRFLHGFWVLTVVEAWKQYQVRTFKILTWFLACKYIFKTKYSVILFAFSAGHFWSHLLGYQVMAVWVLWVHYRDYNQEGLSSRGLSRLSDSVHVCSSLTEYLLILFACFFFY